MKVLAALFAAIALVGCQSSAPTVAPESVSAGTRPVAPPNGGRPAPTAAAQSAGVAPIGSGAAGGLTPMSGAENVGGGTGGGIASAAKDQARKAAGAAGAGSAGQLNTDN